MTVKMVRIANRSVLIIISLMLVWIFDLIFIIDLPNGFQGYHRPLRNGDEDGVRSNGNTGLGCHFTDQC